MAATDTAPQDLLARVRRDVERSRLRARNGLKLLSGVGAPTLGASPKDVVWTSGKVELWRYRSDVRTIRPPLLFVHSLVSRSYVFDLNPGNSYVEFMLQRGFDVFLVNWGVPDELEASNDLSTYADELLPEIVREVCRTTRSETVTMFNDMCAFAPATLLRAPIVWEPIDARTVRGRYTLGKQTITATLHFDANADLVDFKSEDRYQDAGGANRQLPWSTPVDRYHVFADGIRIPRYGVGWWHPPGAAFAYLRMEIEDIAYNVGPSLAAVTSLPGWSKGGQT